MMLRKYKIDELLPENLRGCIKYINPSLTPPSLGMSFMIKIEYPKYGESLVLTQPVDICCESEFYERVAWDIVEEYERLGG